MQGNIIGQPRCMCVKQVSLISHIIEIHNESIHRGRKHPCLHCEYQATVAANLSRHYKSVHQGQGRRYPCKYCDYKARANSHLKRHTKTVHIGIQK